MGRSCPSTRLTFAARGPTLEAMGSEAGAPGRLAGRVSELGLLAQALDEAADGMPRAVVVRGEAGVGKTRLVSAVCEQAAERDLTVLWGTCVRFGAIESTFLPWVMAVERWLASATETDRQRVLAQVPQAAQLLPSLAGAESGTDAVRLMRVLKALVTAIGARRPTVLVMDDVQWADPSSRDVLTYLLAGLSQERLLVLATVRDEGIPAEDPVHSWLADLRRLPAVTELSLARLSLEETAEQVAGLLGAATAPLVRDVHERTGGNPYLVYLLCHDLDARAESLPEGLPEDLSRALLEVWYRLSSPAREATRILAVAGRPAPLTSLERACAATGQSTAASVRAAVAEAIGAGVMVRPDVGQVWFRHPLLAEVLPTTYLSGEAAPIHAAWADQLAERPAAGVEEVRRLGDLALHQDAANRVDECFVASLAAADAARGMRMWREEEAHLDRALRLWPDADPGLTAGHDLATLHERAARAGRYIGHTSEAVEHLSLARRVVEVAGDVRRAGYYRIRLQVYRWPQSDPAASVEEARAIVDLTEAFPDSSEHAEALTNLVDFLARTPDRRGTTAASERAIEAARRSGSARAMCLAHCAQLWTGQQSEETGALHASEAMRWARLSEDRDLISIALDARGASLETSGRLRETADSRAELVRLNLDEGMLAQAVWNSGILARIRLDLGRFEDAGQAVLDGLGFAGDFHGAVHVRLAAGILADRRGDVDAGSMHFDRARELSPALETRIEASPELAEHLIARGGPQAALELIERCLPGQAHDRLLADLLLLWAARACADLAQAGRDLDDADQVMVTLRRLEELVAVRDRAAPEAASPDPVHLAFEALFTAETERAHDRPAPDPWRDAAERARVAELGWEAAVADFRHAEALTRSGAARSEVGPPLRQAYRFATEQAAVPLIRDVETLALGARVPLTEPKIQDVLGNRPNRLTALTPREREVLGHLVAARTYAEIATALFISEKTVSAHVSNLLRKTGTSSSREAVALALRLGKADAD